jgi:hypothetical protein
MEMLNWDASFLLVNLNLQLFRIVFLFLNINYMSDVFCSQKRGERDVLDYLL